jgi:hypothetical protein
MDITREQIEARMAQLKENAAQVQANIVQLQANLNAYQGAIQDCEFWLETVSVETPAVEAKK